MAPGPPHLSDEPRARPHPLSRPLNGPSPLLLAGPTASGKSAVALHLAERIDGEIVTVDSMQVYRGMDVGTAKPGLADRARRPHHLLDVRDPGDPFSAGDFLAEAQATVGQIRERGRPAVFCGGTGLYFKAWTEGLGTSPAPDLALRRSLYNVQTEDLLRELEQGDPAAAARIDHQNRRRLIRAVEILRTTQRPIAEQQTPWTSPADSAAPLICLDRDSADLRRRIDERVDAMFAGGLLEESQRLLDLGLPEDATCLQALGYRQAFAYLQGIKPLDQTIAEVKQRTWKYAKRQRTWFRHQAHAHWILIPPGESAETTATRVESAWKSAL